MLDTMQAIMRAKKIIKDRTDHEIFVAHEELTPLEWQQVAQLAYENISINQHRNLAKTLKYIIQVQWNRYKDSEAGRDLAAIYATQPNSVSLQHNVPENQTLYIYERGKTTPFAKITHKDGSFTDYTWYGYFIEIPKTSILDWQAYQRVAKQTHVAKKWPPSKGFVFIAPFACEFHATK